MLMSSTEVANNVGDILGHTLKISDLYSSQDRLAIQIRRVYNTTMLQTLREFEWAYYRKREPLQLLKKHPTKDWKFGYSVPNNAAVILAVMCEDRIDDYTFSKPNRMRNYEIEMLDENTQIIHTDVPKAWATIIAIPSEGASFDINFGNAFAANLALRVAPAMITNNYFNIRDKLREECKQIKSEAQANDINQTPQREPQYSPALAFIDSFNF